MASLWMGANPFVRGMQEAVNILEGVSGAEDFWELWEEQGKSWVALFSDLYINDAFLRVDASLIRAAAFTKAIVWEKVKGQSFNKKDEADELNCRCTLLDSGGQ